jgi:hypothetical protein
MAGYYGLSPMADNRERLGALMQWLKEWLLGMDTSTARVPEGFVKWGGITVGLGLGAAAFAFFTFILLLGNIGRGPGIDDWVPLLLLFVFATLAAWRRTRLFGVGFFGALLLASLAQQWAVGVWFDPLGNAMKSATARETKAKWVAMWRTVPLTMTTPVERSQRLATSCVVPAMLERTTVPTTRELTMSERCRDFRRDALEIDTVWPARYTKGDDAWRWTVSSSATPSRWGGTGFVIRYEPDPLTEHTGPIFELDAGDLLVIRESKSAPAKLLTSPLPSLWRMRECLLLAADSIPSDSAAWRSLPSARALRRLCRDVNVRETAAVGPDERLFAHFQDRDYGHFSSTLMLYRVLAPGRFELRANVRTRKYLLSADGTWHLAPEDRYAEATDPAPLQCEIDPKVACR